MSRQRRALADLVRGLRGEPIVSPDWMPVLEIANDHLLTPALWSALRESSQAISLPADARDYLATLHRLNGDRNRVLRRQAIELIGALNAQGIVPALLKGGLTLFDGPYADPAMRMMRDLDILVPAGSRDDAIGILERLGYRLAQQYAAGHHAFGDFARPNDPASVDLHTELVDPSHVLPASEVWSRSELREIGGVRYFSPCATDRIMHNLLHAQIHHLGNFYRGELQVQQVHEFVALARHFGPAVDWPFVKRRMHAHHLTAAMNSYLLAAHRLLGLEWPLSSPPGLGARLNYLRCEMQVGVRPLQWIGVPWGNLRGAFAWHRMHALHGSTGGPLRWRCRHLVRYLQKEGIGATLERLLRAH
ncbi:MAG: hypothetical protein A3D94_02110 [Alphaproteobacteria bacterium RIFCSPHIGHO2_12_FULL_66_14]|jgi:hypothetical protein|nr:MAG: hypothetical protein A3D94_02110 [Alphaproteobacteria bacterium RIFCSPHIGHO2_12_FULL_66_14]